MTKTARKEHLGRRIAARRHQRGLSQTILARRVGIDPSYLSRIENGKVHPTIRTGLKISNALRMSLDELVGPSPPDRRNQICPVSGSGQCLLDLIDTGSGPGQGPLVERYTPRQVRLMRRFAGLLHESRPELVRAMEILVGEIASNGKK
jgi:transcriptional regulator with XRE-family HTH domain